MKSVLTAAMLGIMRTFQWPYLPPFLQRLLAAMWPTGEVLNWFHIILEFLEYDHISVARIIHVVMGQNKTINIWHQVQVFY